MSERVLRKIRLTAGGLVLVLLLAALSAFSANYPSWWITRGMVTPNAAITNDFAAVNQGQLKWVATQAKSELDARLSGGAGTAIANLIASFSPTNNYLPVNAGQLKAVAKPFYDRLIAAGLTNIYPWTTNTIADDCDFSLVNQGQVKNAFNFTIVSNTPPGPAISGTISYSGMQTGTIWVVAVTAADIWATNYSARLTAPGPYAITALPTLTNYWIKTWRDSNRNGTNDIWEAFGVCTANPIKLDTNRPGQDVLLADPDTDADSLPDWWEMLYFGNTSSQSGADDYDNDGLTNLDEYLRGSNPATKDYRLTLSSSGAAGSFNLPAVSWYPGNSQVEIQAIPNGRYNYTQRHK